jgi:hypothetical protein
MKNYHSFFLLLLLGLFTNNLIAQKLDTIEVWLDTNVVKTIQYVSIASDKELQGADLLDKSYPVAVIPQSIFKQVLKVNKERVFLNADTQTKITLLERKDSLNSLEVKYRDDFIALQKKHIEDCDATNNQLNKSILSINTQLDKAINLSVASIKHERFKKIGLGVVAGLAGFALGAILAK